VFKRDTGLGFTAMAFDLEPAIASWISFRVTLVSASEYTVNRLSDGCLAVRQWSRPCSAQSGHNSSKFTRPASALKDTVQRLSEMIQSKSHEMPEQQLRQTVAVT
jgi:hypothetical protein